MATSAATEGKPKRTRKRNGDPTAPGRPHDLDRPIPQPDGASIPAGEAILRQMRTGLPIAESAASVGISRGAAYHWRGDGAAIAAAIIAGTLTEARLTDYQQAAWAFFEGATMAEATAEALHATRLTRLASGGYTTKREVEEFDAAGRLLGRKVTTATVPPDPRSVMFALERRWPSRWGRAVRVEHALGAEGPLVQTEASPLAKLTEALEAIERRRDAGRAQLAIIETTSEEEQAS